MVITWRMVALHVGGYKASDIKLVLRREPRTCKTWFHAGSILPNEEHVDAVIRELLGEIGLTSSPIEIEIETVYDMYRMRRFTANTVCAGCCLWARPTMPYMRLISQG
jgi:8-oxo-dGTP pyrophosphatase MutT (NUDIX family)